jgi:hypothetical protein
LPGIAVQQRQHIGRGHQGVVIAPAQRLVEEEVAGLLEARERAQLGVLRLM